MANNSNRKAIEFMVQGALPPHSTNVLWMDTSIPTLPVLKIFENGAWTNVHTEDSKSIELLAETVLAQQREIAQLTNNIETKIDSSSQNIETLQAVVAKDATVAKESSLNYAISNISNLQGYAQSTLAKESTSQEIKELVLQEGIILGNEYAETINDIVGDFSNE